MTGSAEPDWPAIRRLYLEGKLSVASIAKQYGVSIRRIYHRGSQEGWPRRGQPAARRRDAPALASAVRPGRLKESEAEAAAQSLRARRALVRRLYKAIDTKLQQMERRMAQDMAADEQTSDTTAADHERDTRAIGALIANLSRVTEIEADIERTPGSASPADNRADRQLADEAERFRRDVAERLARLVRPG